ncbi:MAG: 50S ribosomal protein L11 methyltransferase [Cytophagaceae bacterium]|jgi:ribosomal protein L11 methyltransferase|nr:50S ribosomal protein L11 methyltransferase [Cytophagaceae bacterium]
MEYTKVTFALAPYTQDNSDIMAAILGEKGFESFVDTANGLEAYIQSSQFDAAVLDMLPHPVSNLSYSCTIETVPDQNWNEYWEKNYFQPIVINNRCVVRSPFHDEFPDIQYRITIMPKMAFGTGHHETTSMMMEYILEHDIAGKRILDMGCGTGILGILASMRGAREVIAIDNDHWCTENTVENCRMNSILNMTAILGNAETLDGVDKFDIILANINRNILLKDIPKYKKVLNNGGMLVVSGFYDNDIERIDAVCDASQMGRKKLKTADSWVAVAYE